MDHYTIHAMVRALKPVLNDRGRAERILERFWADRHPTTGRIPEKDPARFGFSCIP